MNLSSTRRVLTASLLGAFLVGCGGGSNNDQGSNFTLTNFNALDEENVCELDLFISETAISLSSQTNPEVRSPGSGVCYTVQNNLQSRYVRVDRVFIDYYVDGAREQPPSTSLATSGVLGPVATTTTGTGASPGTVSTDPSHYTPGNPPQTSLPPGFQAANKLVKGLTLVPASIHQWLALNRAQLPEPPFQMDAIVRVAGETSAGDRIETNPANITVHVLPDNPISSPTTTSGLEEGEEDE